MVAELQGLLGRAEEGLSAQGLVGTEVEMIKQQLQEFKVGQTFAGGYFPGCDVCRVVLVKVCLCSIQLFVLTMLMDSD